MDPYAFRDGICQHKWTQDGRVTISGPCYHCGQQISVSTKDGDLLDFRNGKFAQDAFPYLSAGEREFLISGFCNECWDKLFSEPEEGSLEW